MGASRRPVQVLNKKLHDQMGFALRKYVKHAGSQYGSVQQKTIQLLQSLHEDFVGEGDLDPMWKVCLERSTVVERAGLQQTPGPPPGLELLSVAESDRRSPDEEEFELFSVAELDGQAPDEEESLHTPRPNSTTLAASCTHTPVKNRESARVGTPQCEDTAHVKADTWEDIVQPSSSESAAHSWKATQALRSMYITMQGDSVGKKQRSRMVDDLVVLLRRLWSRRDFLVLLSIALKTTASTKDKATKAVTRSLFLPH